MVAFASVQNDDLVAFVGCAAALGICGLTLQLVHFIQHRKRPLSSCEPGELTDAQPPPSSLAHQSAKQDSAA